jgi:hypothetical protein
MKKKQTSENDIVELVVEEAFIKDKHKHCTEIEMALDMLAYRVVIAEKTIEVDTLGKSKKPYENKKLR